MRLAGKTETVYTVLMYQDQAPYNFDVPNSNVGQSGGLHRTLAHRLIVHIKAERFCEGRHLTEQALEKVLGVSRSPVRGALSYLVDLGIVHPRPPRRGLFLKMDADRIPLPDTASSSDGDDEAYLALASDRLRGALGPVIGEADLMRRYALTRQRLGRVLDRAANEGWIERRASKGWRFLPMIDGPVAYRESYELRRLLEPSAMRLPGFALDTRVLAKLREQQQALVDGGYASASHVELFVANSTFHEALAGLSNNRFVVQTVVRQNQLRRLVEYREIDDRARVRRQCEEHVAIVSLLERGERGEAAALLARHIGDACEEKVLALTKMSSPAEGAQP